MSITYHDLLKDDKSLSEDKAKQIEQQVSEDVAINERLNWTSHPTTKKYLEQLLVIYHDIFVEVSAKSSNVEIKNEELRYKLVELNTIRKIINQLKYGQYIESVTDGNTNPTTIKSL